MWWEGTSGVGKNALRITNKDISEMILNFDTLFKHALCRGSRRWLSRDVVRRGVNLVYERSRNSKAQEIGRIVRASDVVRGAR